MFFIPARVGISRAELKRRIQVVRGDFQQSCLAYGISPMWGF